MKLNPQAITILNILQDRQWHCPIEWGYADGHTKRITDINEYLKPQGLMVQGDWCNCGRHASKIKRRRIVQLDQEKPHSVPNFAPQTPLNVRPPSEFVKKFLATQWRPEVKTQPKLF